jgi:hypothetical protein
MNTDNKKLWRDNSCLKIRVHLCLSVVYFILAAIFSALIQRRKNSRFIAGVHLHPPRNLIQGAEAAEANAVAVHFAKIYAWRRDIHAGSKSQNQNPFVCFAPDGQT